MLLKGTLVICTLMLLQLGGTSASNSKLGLFEVTVESDIQMEKLKAIAATQKWEWWKQPGNAGTAVQFTADGDANADKMLQQIQSILLPIGIRNVHLINSDLEKTVNEEMRQNEMVKSKIRARSAKGEVYEYFARHGEYNAWLKEQSIEYRSTVTLKNIGKSYEGRDMVVIKLSTGGNKPAIFMDGGIHAREWLAVSSVVYILNKFLDGRIKGDPAVKGILEKFDVYFLPVTNPDGYELTHKGGRNRLWRKNTMPVANQCKGVDLNRNFDSDFGKTGVSKNPCDIIYPGEKPFSAPETRNFRDFVLSIKDRLKLFISFHAFSQLLLTPWAYTKKLPADNDEMMRVAHKMVAAIKKTSGLTYKAGSPAHILYAASGGCYDWVKQKAGVKYSYTFEVRPDMRDRRGFVAPVEWIKPAGEELFAAVVAAANSVK